MTESESDGPVSLWTVLTGHTLRTRARVVARLLRGHREFVLLGPPNAEDTARHLAQDAEDRRFGSVFAPERGEPYTCPCCGHATLTSRGEYDWCKECDWEDDGQDDHDSHLTRRNGPNGVSLDAAREHYLASGRQRGNHVPPAPPSTG